MDTLLNTTIFLIDTLFTLYLVFIILRILLPMTHNSYHNPISQFVIRVTNPCVMLFRKIIPWHTPFDFAAATFLILFEILHRYLYGWLQTRHFIPFDAVLVWSIGELLGLLMMIWFWTVIAQAILSWIATPHRNFVTLQATLHHITAPILRPIQRFIPPIGGLDISPLIALLLIYLANNLIVYPIINMGISLAFR